MIDHKDLRAGYYWGKEVGAFGYTIVRIVGRSPWLEAECVFSRTIFSKQGVFISRIEEPSDTR